MTNTSKPTTPTINLEATNTPPVRFICWLAQALLCETSDKSRRQMTKPIVPLTPLL
ncbi:hypothetical protein ANO14919_071430 [Xylariales sp. No.14919]|nr:hypothetical protein ANO14919_071430 [Xylariales sp. No.14919]